MTDAATTAPAATEATATNGKPAAGTRELAEHYAKQAIIARNKDVADAQEGMAAARSEGDPPAEEQAAAPSAGRERGKDGKFKPKAGEAKAAPKEKPEEGEAPAPAEEPPPEPAAAGAIGQARKLVREGNIAGALQLIGLHPDKLEGKQWGAFRQREKAAQEAERKALDLQQQLREVHGGLLKQYGAYEEARKLYEAEDYDGAFKLWTGESPDDFQRKRIYGLQSKTKDPELVKLRKELDALRTEKQTEEQRRAEQQRTQAREAARADYRTKLAEQLTELDDPRFARVAKKQAFVNRVFDIQEQHWNERAQETIDTVEAAELAWEELYEGVAGETSATTAPSVSRSAGTAKTPARQVARATTTLNPHEASEASPAHKLKPGSKELREFYARKAELAAVGVALESDGAG